MRILPGQGVCVISAPHHEQGCAPTTFLVSLARKVHLAVVREFPTISKACIGLVYLLMATLSYWWIYGELWGIVGNYGELWGIVDNFGELWGIEGIYRKFWCLVGCCLLLLLYGPLIVKTWQIFILKTMFFMCDSPIYTKHPENTFLRGGWRSK